MDCPERMRPLLSAMVKGEHNGHLAAGQFHGLVGCVNGSLCIEGIEDCFAKQCIHPTLYEGLHLLGVCIDKGVEREIAQSGVLHVGAHRAGAACGAHRAHHITWFNTRIGDGGTARYPCRGKVYFAAQMGTAIVGLGNAVGIKSAGFNDVGTTVQVLAMYLLDNIGAGEYKKVVVAFELHGVSGKTLATEVLLGERVLLYHCAHCTVEHKYSLF